MKSEVPFDHSIKLWLGLLDDLINLRVVIEAVALEQFLCIILRGEHLSLNPGYMSIEAVVAPTARFLYPSFNSSK